MATEKKSAEAAAAGRFVHVYVDSETRRTVAVPDVIRRAIEPLKKL